MKITQKIKFVSAQERVDPLVVERKAWSKFGVEKNRSLGPNTKITNFGEEITLKLGPKVIKKEEQEPVKKATTSKSLKCRICKGDHFTSKCPMKDYASASVTASVSSTPAAAGKSTYTAPHLRNGASAAPKPALGERDDSTTLRVSNLSNDVIEEDLREIFGKFGHITRCNIVRDRETGRSRGFGFISFDTIPQAEKAQERLDKHGLDNLIINVEFSGKNR